MTKALPPGYEALEPFVAQFAVEGTANRAALRSNSSAEDRLAFHSAAHDRVGPALELLDKKPVNDLDGGERRLLNLCLSFAHIALAVEMQGENEPNHAVMRKSMRITRSPADAAA